MCRLRTLTSKVRCVIVSDQATLEALREALRFGACDWLDEPFSDGDLLDAVKRALPQPNDNDVRHPQLLQQKPHAASRLADAAIAFIEAPEDRPTLRLLGRAIGHASGCLRNWCHTAGLKARSYRDFVRALRAVYRLEHEPSAREANLLEIVDNRTLKKFVAMSGGLGLQLPRSVTAFVEQQRFIRDPAFLAAVSTTLRLFGSCVVEGQVSSRSSGADSHGPPSL
jgi:hypothetical protein